MEKIGVYVCHCGTNIAGIVDVQEVAEWAAARHIRRRIGCNKEQGAAHLVNAGHAAKYRAGGVVTHEIILMIIKDSPRRKGINADLRSSVIGSQVLGETQDACLGHRIVDGLVADAFAIFDIQPFSFYTKLTLEAFNDLSGLQSGYDSGRVPED